MKRSSFFASLVALLCAVMTQMTAQALELTVHDGTAGNSYVPFYGFYYDDSAGVHAQMVFPASELAAMSGANITAIKWYDSETTEINFAADNVIYLKEVSYTTISAYEAASSCTIVYGGTVIRASDGTISVTFDTPFTYNGGNLLVGFETTTGGYYKTTWFYGETVAGASLQHHGSGSGGVQRNFLPKTTFTYNTPCAHDGGTSLSGYVAETCTAGGYTGDTVCNLCSATLATGYATMPLGHDIGDWVVTIAPTVATAGEKTKSCNRCHIVWATAPIPPLPPSVTGLPTDNATVTTNGVAAVVGAGGTLTGLSTNVTVKATPADGYQFTAFTAARTSPLSISYKLDDSWGDGWNGGAAIQVVDNDTETVITNLTLESGSLLEGTLPVADGANLRFQWKAGSCDYECAYTIKGVNGEVVLAGVAALATPVVYNVTSAVAVTENPDGSRSFTMPNDDVAVTYTLTTTAVIANYNDWVQVNSATVGGTGLWYETKSGTANGLCYIFNKAPGTTSGIFSTAKVGSDQVVTTPASPRTDAGFKVKIRASDDPLGTVNVKYYDVSSTGNTVLTGEGAAPTRFFCLVTTLDSYGPGDLDGDGKYTANDTAIINNYILYRALGASTPRFAQFDLSPAAMAAADVDGNGVVDGTDMALIQKGVEDMSVYSGN